MAWIEPDDFHTGTKVAWTEGLDLDEADGDETYLEGVIALIQLRIEDELKDTFEAAGGDPDTTVDLNVSRLSRTLDVGRRVRAITSVSTQSSTGAFTVEPATLFRRISTDPPAPRDELLINDGLYLSAGGYWPMGFATVRIVGKFGYLTPPDDIKRLCALRVYDFVRPRDDPFSSITERTTVDGTITYGPGEAEKIVQRYSRIKVFAR